jgi:outer membrane protein TolC
MYCNGERAIGFSWGCWSPLNADANPVRPSESLTRAIVAADARKVARQGNEAAKQAASLTQLEVGANAGSAFFDLAAAEQLVTVAQANVRRYESFDTAVHVLVENSLRPGADASQADAQLALARNQLIQVQTQAALRWSALAKYLQTAQTLTAIDASQVLASLPAPR